MSSELVETGFRPEVGAASIQVPYTLNYSGGRSATRTQNIVWAVLAFLGIAILFVGMLFMDRNLFVKLPLAVGICWFLSYLVRVFLLKERMHRKEMESRLENDYRVSMENFYSLYAVSENGFCYFNNNSLGVFVMLQKAPVIGKNEQDKYEHYEAIADAINQASSLRDVQFMHIDLMDYIGKDKRVSKAYGYFRSTRERKALAQLYPLFRHLDQISENTINNYDIYVFKTTSDIQTFTNSLNDVINCFLNGGNYLDFHFLQREEIQNLTKSLFNLEEFSITEAERESYLSRYKTSLITPISLIRGGGEEIVYNKTSEQKRKEAEDSATRARIQKQSAKSRRASRRAPVVVEEDLMGGSTVDLTRTSTPTSSPSPFELPSAQQELDLMGEVVATSQSGIDPASRSSFSFASLDDVIQAMPKSPTPSAPSQQSRTSFVAPTPAPTRSNVTAVGFSPEEEEDLMS